MDRRHDRAQPGARVPFNGLTRFLQGHYNLLPRFIPDRVTLCRSSVWLESLDGILSFEPRAIWHDNQTKNMERSRNVSLLLMVPANNSKSTPKSLGQPQAVQARAVLEELFELLEAYGPTWYTEEHQKRALAALVQQ